MTKPTTLKTFLWFDGNLGEALEFYAATFANFVLHSSGRPEADGKLMTSEFSIHGHEFIVSTNPAKSAYAWAALRKMKKIIIQDFIEQ